MRLPLALRSLASGVCVYFVVAACGASESAISTALDGGEAGAIADAFVERMTDPVEGASAEPLPPDVATEPCSTVLKYSGVDYYFAVHAYPGKSAEALALVHAVVPQTAVEGYKYAPAVSAVKDGSVAAMCGSASAGQPTHSITFIMPR